MEKGWTLLPAGAGRPLVVLPAPAEEGRELFDGSASLLCLEGLDWARDLTPWPAPGLQPDRPFLGGGPALLRALLEEILPEAEAALGAAPAWRGIAGYSLAGLFALWAFCETELFACAASVSGSLWYEGLPEYLAGRPNPRSGRVYLSVGARERRTRLRRMACVEERCVLTQALLQARGVEVFFARNPGTHFTDPVGRMRRALQWLTGAPEP